MTKRYPLHHEDAEPLYKEITQDEYDRLVKAEQELKKLQKNVFDFAGRVIDHVSERMDGWIPVSERKPDINGRRIVFITKTGRQCFGFYRHMLMDGEGEKIFREDTKGYACEYLPKEVEYWYELPAVPCNMSEKQEMLEAGIKSLRKG